MSSIYDPKPAKCQCCGESRLLIASAICDQETGRNWSTEICEQCNDHCSDDGVNPVHMSPEWDGSPETFEACRCTPAS